MNIQDLRHHKELTEAIQWLCLTAHNTEVALEYFTASTADDALLNQVELQNNFRGMPRENVIYAFNSFIRYDGKVLDRLLKFLWAAGGTAVCEMVSQTYFNRISDQDTAAFRASVLGNVRAAVMEATGLFGGPNVARNSLQWLCDLARNHPEELLAAQEMCQGPEAHGGALLASLLLRLAPERVNVQVQRHLLHRSSLNAIPRILFGLPGKDIQMLVDYVDSGDLNEPVPIPPSIRLPAVDVASAQNATWLERSALRHYGMTALLTAEQDEKMRRLLRMILMLYPKQVFFDAAHYLEPADFGQILSVLREDTPGGGISLALFFANSGNWAGAAKEVFLEHCREDMVKAMQNADPDQYLSLLDEGMEPLPARDVREKLARWFGAGCVAENAGRIRAFVMEEHDLSDHRIRLAGIQPGRGGVRNGCMRLLGRYIREEGLDDFAIRCAALAGLLWSEPGYNILCWLPSGGTNAELMKQIMQRLCERGLPVVEVLTICGKMYDDSYWDELKISVRKAALSVAELGTVSDFEWVLKNGGIFLRGIALECLDRRSAESGAKEAILSAIGDSSKQVREQVARILPRHPEWAADYKGLLTAKKAAVRIMAAEALGRLGERDALEAALGTEKNAKIIDAIRAALGAENAAPVGSAAELARGLTGGNKLKKLSWLISDSLLTLRNADGTPSDDSIRNAILLSYSELGRIGRSDTAAELAKELDKGDLQRLAVQVYDLWFAAGAQAKQKWVLPFAAVFGGEAMTPRLNKAIHDWPEHQRGAIACDAVMALALSTDPAAIVIVDSISRKFKFRQVKVAAAAALENAARELGISAEELADRIVPDLGFGKDGKRVFDYGKRSFTVRLTATLELEIVNDQGKAVKTMPAPGKTDDPQAAEAYEAFKTMKKQIKTTVAAQRARLESALSVLRCWDTERWKALFVENPIMHQFAMSLIWGVYEDGKLTDTFRYMEDGTFNTVDEEEYTLPENGKIGMVHPVELDEDTLEDWKQQLEDYEISQSIDQLGRTIHILDKARAGEKALEDFGGKMLNSLSLSGKLLKQGWYRGSIVDGGGFFCFYREDKELGIGAELRFSGAAVGYDDGEDVTVFDAVFYTGTINRGSYVYDTISDEQIVPLGDVPARYYSEIVHQLTIATASSTRSNENWRTEMEK